MAVAQAEVVLRRRVALAGRLAVPLQRLLFVARTPWPIVEDQAEIELRTGVVLLGGAAVPQDGLLAVLRHIPPLS